MPRPHRVWGYLWTTAAAVLGSLAFLVGVIAVDTRNSLCGCLVPIASYPVYPFARRNAAIAIPVPMG